MHFYIGIVHQKMMAERFQRLFLVFSRVESSAIFKPHYFHRRNIEGIEINFESALLSGYDRCINDNWWPYKDK